MSNKDNENNLDEKAFWPKDIEEHFIHLLHEEAKKDLQNYNLDKHVWAEIEKRLFDKFGRTYNREKLRAKYNRLRKIHREFEKLIAHTGMSWDPNTNIVQASEEVWVSYLKKNKFASCFRRKGCPHYDLLCVIFNYTTAIGQMQYASTHSPRNSDVDRGIETEVLTVGAHIGLNTGSGSKTISEGHEGTSNTNNLSEGHEGTSNKNKRCALFPLSDLPSNSKSSKLTKVDEALEAWAKALNAKIEVSLAKIDRTAENEVVSSPFREVSSIEDCMEVLEGMEDVGDAAYLKALEKFNSSNWRRMFMKMSDSRKRVWLNSLR